MSEAADLTFARLIPEEGTRNDAYDDATGKTVRAPVGILSWGRGFNLSACASVGLFDAMERYLIAECEGKLNAFYWYTGLDPVRRSVILDMAYNMGVDGLLHYPKMIAALVIKDWLTAAKECTVKQVAVDSTRYADLRHILITGTESASA